MPPKPRTSDRLNGKKNNKKKKDDEVRERIDRQEEMEVEENSQEGVEEEPEDQEMADDDNWEAPPKDPKTAKKTDPKSKKGEKRPQEKETTKKTASKGRDVLADKDKPGSSPFEKPSVTAKEFSERSSSAKDEEKEIIDIEKKSVIQVVSDLLRTRLLDKFTGEAGEGKPTGTAWLTSTWETLSSLSGVLLSESEKVQCVYHCLGSNPKQQVTTYLNGRSTRSLTYAELSTLFGTVYTSALSDIAFDNALNNFVYMPDDTPSTFMARFHALYLGKPALSNDSQKLRDLRRVLPKPMKDSADLLWSTFTSIKQAQDWVVSNLANYVKPGAVNTFSFSKSNSVPSETSQLTAVLNNLTQIVANLQGKHRSGKFKGKCYNCDQRGHIAKDCPKPKKPKVKQDKKRFDKDDKPANKSEN